MAPTAKADESRSKLTRAAAELASRISSPALPRTIVEVACELVDAKYGSAVVLAPDSAVSDVATKDVACERRHVGDLTAGVLGMVLASDKPVRLPAGSDVSLFSLPRHHGPVPFLGARMVTADSLLGALCLGERVSGDEFTDEHEVLLDWFSRYAAMALSLARLKREAVDREPVLRAVQRIADALLEGGETDDVLRLVATSARTLVGASLAAVLTPSADGSSMVVRIAEGASGRVFEGEIFNAAASSAGDAMRLGRPLVLDASSQGAVGPPAWRPEGTGSAAFVPLAVGDRRFGCLLVANDEGGASLTATDLLLVQAFASDAAMALELGRIRTELQRLSLLEERQRIATELHDGVVQSLFAVGLSLQAAEMVVSSPADVGPHLNDAMDRLDGAIRELRNYIYSLRPDGVADRNLDEALREFADDY